MRPQRLIEGEKRARRVLRVWRATNEWTIARYPEWADHYDDDGPLFQVMRFTRVQCSCIGCSRHKGRRYGEVTRQERQADERMRAELEDVLEDVPLPRMPLSRRWFNVKLKPRP